MDCFFYPSRDLEGHTVLEIYTGTKNPVFPGESLPEHIGGTVYFHSRLYPEQREDIDLLNSLLENDSFLEMMAVNLLKHEHLPKNFEPKIMGVVNCTPDSFYPGSRLTGQFQTGLEKILEEKPDIIDLGGESTRPGAPGISWREEVERIRPALKYLSENSSIPLSIDTRNPETVSALSSYGISMVNDVTGMRSPAMRKIVCDNNLDAVIMHMRGNPSTMQSMTEYENIVAEINRFFFEQIRMCREDGIDSRKLLVDPGIGFAKDINGNLEILRNIDSFRIGQRVLVGTSRKSFIGKITDSNVEDRLPGTIATSIYLASRGIDALRVHDIKANRDAIRMSRLLGSSDRLA